MSNTVGRIVDFDPQVETWQQQYAKHLEHYFVANGVIQEDKKAVLLAVMSPQNYKLLRNLVSPELPKEKSFKDIVEILGKHHNPPPSEIVQRFKFFNTRVRKPEESVATFIAELRALSEHCQFGETLNTMLRDGLVCGVNNENIQKRLLAESTLTFEDALKIATSMEAGAAVGNSSFAACPQGHRHQRKELKMEVDTGAAVSIVSNDIYQKLWPKEKLDESNIVLRTYSGEQIKQIGSKQVEVKYNGQVNTVELVVVEGKGPSLFGRNWLQHFRLDWKNLLSVKEDYLQSLLKKYNTVLRKV